jgi:hypothetical protein
MNAAEAPTQESTGQEVAQLAHHETRQRAARLIGEDAGEEGFEMVGEHAVQSGCLWFAAPPDVGESCHIEKWQRGADWLRGKGEAFRSDPVRPGRLLGVDFAGPRDLPRSGVDVTAGDDRDPVGSAEQPDPGLLALVPSAITWSLGWITGDVLPVDGDLARVRPAERS